MSNPYGRITANHEVIYPRYDPKKLVEQQWLVELVAQFRDSDDRHHLIIVGEPGSGKTSFMAFLAESWNCPRHFIRVDHTSGVTDLDAHAFLLSLGTQLYQKYGREIFELDERRITRVTVGLAKDQAEVVGRVIEELHTPLPFLSQQSDEINVKVGAALGQSKVIGERVHCLVDTSYSLPVTTLLHLALIQPLLKLQELYPREKVVIFIDALDESLHHPGPSIVNVIPKAADASFPSNLRFVMTSRPGDHLVSFRKQDQLHLDDEKAGYRQKSLKDALAYIGRKLGEEPLKPIIRLMLNSEVNAFITKVEKKSNGNFLYLYHLFNAVTDAVRLGETNLNQIMIPANLDEIYRFFAVERIRKRVPDVITLRVKEQITIAIRQSLEQIDVIEKLEVDGSQLTLTVQESDKAVLQLVNLAKENDLTVVDLKTQRGIEIGVWEEKFLPVLGILAVAYEAINTNMLAKFAGVEVIYADSVTRELQEFLTTSSDEEENRHQIYHRDFAEFLSDGSRNRDFFLNGPEHHYKIASFYRGDQGNWNDVDWNLVNDTYPFNHLASHLAASKHYEELSQLLVPESKQNLWMNALLGKSGTHLKFLLDLDRLKCWAEDERMIGLQINCALYYTTLTTLSRRLPAEVIGLFVKSGLLSLAQALEHATLSLPLPHFYDSVIREICANLPRNISDQEMPLLLQHVNEMRYEDIKQEALRLIDSINEPSQVLRNGNAGRNAEPSKVIILGGSWEVKELRVRFKDYIDAAESERANELTFLLHFIKNNLKKSKRSDMNAGIAVLRHIRDEIPVERLPEAIDVLHSAGFNNAEPWFKSYFFRNRQINVLREGIEALTPRIEQLDDGGLRNLIAEFKKISNQFLQIAIFAEFARVLPPVPASILVDEIWELTQQQPVGDHLSQRMALFSVASFCSSEVWNKTLEKELHNFQLEDIILNLENILPNLVPEERRRFISMVCSSEHKLPHSLYQQISLFAPYLDEISWEVFFARFIGTSVAWINPSLSRASLIKKLADSIPERLKGSTLDAIADCLPIDRDYALAALAPYLSESLMLRAIHIADSIFLDTYNHHQYDNPQYPIYSIQELPTDPIEIKEASIGHQGYWNGLPHQSLRQELERMRGYQINALGTLVRGLGPERLEKVFFGICELMQRTSPNIDQATFLAAGHLYNHLNLEQQESLKEILLNRIHVALNAESSKDFYSIAIALPILKKQEILRILQDISRSSKNDEEQAIIVALIVRQLLPTWKPKLAWQILSSFLQNAFHTKSKEIVNTLVEIFPGIEKEEWPNFFNLSNCIYDPYALVSFWSGIAPHVKPGNSLAIERMIAFILRGWFPYASQKRKIYMACRSLFIEWHNVDEEEAYKHWKLLLHHATQVEREFLFDMIPSLMPLALSFAPHPQNEAKKIYDIVRKVTSMWP